jgi:hypothetical protein
MVKNLKKGFNGDYGVKLTPNKLNVLCEVDWLGWPLERPLDKTVVNEAYGVIVKTRQNKHPGKWKSQEAKTGLQNPDSCLFKFR